MKINEFKQVLRSLIQEQYAEIFQTDPGAVQRLAKVVYQQYEELGGDAKTYQEFDTMMRSWLMTQPRIWNRQDINVALKRVWKVVHRDLIGQRETDAAPEAGVAVQDSQLSELAKEILSHFEEHGADIDSADELKDSFSRNTHWIDEITADELDDAVNDVWHFAHG